MGWLHLVQLSCICLQYRPFIQFHMSAGMLPFLSCLHLAIFLSRTTLISFQACLLYGNPCESFQDPLSGSMLATVMLAWFLWCFNTTCSSYTVQSNPDADQKQKKASRWHHLLYYRRFITKAWRVFPPLNLAVSKTLINPPFLEMLLTSLVETSLYILSQGFLGRIQWQCLKWKNILETIMELEVNRI